MRLFTVISFFSCTNNTIREEDGMIYIPGGEVNLGPRILAAVEGWTPPKDPMGITPNQGKGKNNRAAGGPPAGPLA